MTDARTDTERRDLDTFVSMVTQACVTKLQAMDSAMDSEAFAAMCMGRAPAPIDTTARQRLLELPGTIEPGTREELAAQWPADFPPLSWAFLARDDVSLTLGLPDLR
jgi:hypothetical protein